MPRMTLRSLLRVLVLTVAAVLGAQGLVAASADCCTSSAIKSAVSDTHQCCESDAAAEDSRSEECPCPLPCSPGCTEHGFRALTAGSTAVVWLPGGIRVQHALHHDQRPPGPEPGDILHVPKSIRS